MPISSIARILLRLFALNWFFRGLIQIAAIAYLIRQSRYDWHLLTTPVAYLLLGILCWLLSPRLARLAARGDDREVNLSGVTAQQLYTAVFVGLGLYFALSSISEAFHGVQSLMYYEINADDSGPEQREFPYEDLTTPLLTLLTGIVMITTSRKWAAKLSQQPEISG